MTGYHTEKGDTPRVSHVETRNVEATIAHDTHSSIFFRPCHQSSISCSILLVSPICRWTALDANTGTEDHMSIISDVPAVHRLIGNCDHTR